MRKTGDRAIDARVDALLDQMTLKEMILQMDQYFSHDFTRRNELGGVTYVDMEKLDRLLRGFCPGSIQARGMTPEQINEVQRYLAATGTPTVLVLQTGRPVTAVWEQQHIPAILEAWFPGEEGGWAVAETLFGDHNPSGHLPITFPRHVGQIPCHYSRRPGGGKRYVEMDWLPLYPFEEKRVSLTISPKAMRTLDRKFQWHVEPGDFRVFLAENAEKPLMSRDFRVEETSD